MIEVFVESIRVNMASKKRVVMMKELHGQRYLPCWIGHFEADAIAIPMQKIASPRPLTHDFYANTLIELGVHCVRAEISRLHEETFYAALVLEHNGQLVEIDCRPSDALSVAIRARAPIFVADDVMASAGLLLDSEVKGDESKVVVVPAETGLYWPGTEPVSATRSSIGQMESVTDQVSGALTSALANGLARRRPTIGPASLMFGLMRQSRAAAQRILAALDVDLAELDTVIESERQREWSESKLTPSAEAVLLRATQEADGGAVASEHVLLALAESTGDGLSVALAKLGISGDTIRRQIALLRAQAPGPEQTPGPEQAPGQDM